MKRLNREVARLEQFRRNLLRQLQDDGGHEVRPCAGAGRPTLCLGTRRGSRLLTTLAARGGPPPPTGALQNGSPTAAPSALPHAAPPARCQAADASPASLVAVDVTTERLVQDVLSGCKGAAPDQSAPAPLAPPAERLALPDGGGRGAGGAGKAALGAAKGGAGAPAADVGGRGGGGGGGGGVDQRAGPLAHAGGLGDAASGGDGGPRHWA